MRCIYVDEAGTSKKEAVSTVVGIIVQADTQWKKAEQEISDILTSVPQEFRSNFNFHASDIWNQRKYPGWSFEGRCKTLHQMMSLPRKLDMPISIGIVRRTAPKCLPMFSLAEEHHLFAFYYCLAWADKYVRSEETETAVVIMEDVPSMRNYFKNILFLLKKQPITLGPEHLKQPREDILAGKSQKAVTMKATTILDSVHFAKKGEAPLIQIADACAFGFRRYFCAQSHGESFVTAILGSNFRDPSDWDGPCSAATFTWNRPG